jgi:ribosomal protein L29
MTLQELSKDYEEAAKPLRLRLHQLRKMLASATEPEEIWHIKRRIAELTPMLTEMNELAELTARYYERGYYRSEKYTL